MTGDTFLTTIENTALYHVPVGTVFQLDGAPPHFSHHVHAFLEGEFPDHWIGRRRSISWSPCSPDVAPLDFFFWGFVKDIVYCEKVQNVNELHDKIIRTAECITNDMLANTWQENELSS
jgi:hypothetical protein